MLWLLSTLILLLALLAVIALWGFIIVIALSWAYSIFKDLKERYEKSRSTGAEG